MLLKRTFAATVLNRALGDGRDMTPAVHNVDNVALVNEHGGFIFEKYAEGVYEVHTQFVPEGRGRLALEAAREAARFMFLSTDCVEILTKCKDDNRPAAVLTRVMGFRKLFRSGACDYYSLAFEDWRAQDASVLAAGQRFHAELEAAGVSPNHPEDEAHDRAAGAAYEMFLRGNPVKAAGLYNRWARFAGYRLVALLSISPLVVDIGDAVLGIGKANNSLEVLSCRGPQ